MGFLWCLTAWDQDQLSWATPEDEDPHLGLREEKEKTNEGDCFCFQGRASAAKLLTLPVVSESGKLAWDT